jgi:hypothetical protein
MSDRITTLDNINIDTAMLQLAYEQLIEKEYWNEHNQLCFLNTPGTVADMHQGVGNHYAADIL